MNRKKFGLRLMGLMVFGLGLCLLWAAQPAQANVTRWARWKVDFGFPNDKMDAVLTVQVGHTTTSGQKVIDQEKSYTVTCQAIGNVVVRNEEATFDGSSYYQCSVPSIKQKVAQMTNGTLIIADACDSKRPYIAGALTIEDNPVQRDTNNPLFYRDDISFDTPLDVATQEAQLLAAFDQAEAESSSFLINTSGHNVTVIYNKTGANQYTPAFTADSLSLTSTPATINGPIPLSTLASTVYVGYSPESGKYFEGSLQWLLVDPYCVGTG